jgi:tetratricopeptide (TPR) repeat protein
MKLQIICIVLSTFCFFQTTYAQSVTSTNGADTMEVIKLNKQAFESRLTDAKQTIVGANKALALARQINYLNGMGEANRILGIGTYHFRQYEESIHYYLTAIKWFQQSNNQFGLAKVNNNIGNLYFENDYDMALEYFLKSLKIGQLINNKNIIASAYLNLGNVYTRKKNFNTALDYYTKSKELFTGLNDVINLIQCYQNLGVIYFSLSELQKAEDILLKANSEAKKKDLNATIASIDLTLTSLYLAKSDFNAAENYLKEGLLYSNIVKSTKLQDDYKLTRYELEFKRKDYKSAVTTLREIYTKDSVTFKNNESIKLKLLNEQYKQIEKEHENDLIIQRQKNDRNLFWASTIVAALLFVVIVLLSGNVNRKAKTNKRLTELNAKISEQKENLNQINHHLEEIIDERTMDLQVKNKKLADYSLHLSHQIRGPIATLRGLLNLEKETLIEPLECLKLINKCVSEIDDNIIDISGMLHESGTITTTVV